MTICWSIANVPRLDFIARIDIHSYIEWLDMHLVDKSCHRTLCVGLKDLLWHSRELTRVQQTHAVIQAASVKNVG